MIRRFLFLLVLLITAFGAAPHRWLPPALQPLQDRLLGSSGYREPPASEAIDVANVEPACANEHPEWREEQVIEGVTIERSPACEPDNPTRRRRN